MSTHWLSRAVPRAAGALTLALGLLTGANAIAQEQRCDELGASCVCSEPMNVSDGGIPSGHDFSDSPSASECDRFGKFYDSNKSSSQVRTVSESGMPAGNTTSHVLEVTDAGGAIVWLNGRPRPAASDERVCVRYYFQVSSDFSGAGPNNVGCPSERNKLLQFSFGSASPYQVAEYPGGSCQGPPGSGLAPYGKITSIQHGMSSGGAISLSPGVDWTSCSEGEGWCRLESCVHGDLQSGRNIYVDTKIKALRTGVESVKLNHGPINPGQGLSLASADIFHGQGSGPVGSRFISHFMQAAWSTDAGQWIGSAYEVESGSEGGQGGTTPPTPTPDPDPPPAQISLEPPTLLGQSASSGGAGGLVALDTSVSMSGTSPTVTAVVTNGSGPYHFLYDCGNDGNWNGVDDMSTPASSYTCSGGTDSVRVRMWDEGTNVVLDDLVDAN